MVRLSLLFCALACSAQTLIIKNVTVIDATDAPPRKGVSVAIEGDRIMAIQKNVRAPRGVRVIDGKGKFLIPGLWDMHMHLPVASPPFDELVAHGITGVREMFSGVPPALLEAWRARPDVPRIVTAGFIDAIRTVGADGQPAPGAFAVASAPEARAAVRFLARQQYDFIKVYNSLSREAFLGVADQAKMLGIPFAGHVPESVSVGEASDAGMRSQEHLNNVLLACSSKEDDLRAARVALLRAQIAPEERLRLLAFPKSEGLFDTYDPAKAAALFEKFVKNGTWHTPTLVLLDGFVQRPDFTRAQFYMRDLDSAGFEAILTRIRSLLDRHKQLVGDMHRAGVPLLAGTDTSAFTATTPGESLHRELELLVASGLNTLAALQTATRNPAIYFNKLAEMGTIEVGKAADLVLLDADPLQDISNVRKIRGVVLRGIYRDIT